MNDPTLEQVATAFEAIYEERRQEFEGNIELANLKARQAAIEDALQDECISKAYAFELLDELAEIETKLQEMGE